MKDFLSKEYPKYQLVEYVNSAQFNEWRILKPLPRRNEKLLAVVDSEYVSSYEEITLDCFSGNKQWQSFNIENQDLPLFLFMFGFILQRANQFAFFVDKSICLDRATQMLHKGLDVSCEVICEKVGECYRYSVTRNDQSELINSGIL